MKKLSVLLSAALVMFALSGCQNDIEEGINANSSAEGSSFVLSADIVSTRTTTDAATYEVDWENGDVIYVVTTNGIWGPAYQSGESDDAKAKEFTYNATENVFTTEATIANGTYTFNALYATASQKSYHRGATTTHKLYAEQSMDAEASTATLKENDALAGQFELTTPDEAAGTVAMKHIYTLMQVNVKNTTGADIEVTNFQMTAADAALAGVFTVTFGETPSVAINRDSADTISVDVTNGTVANDASLPIYFVMAPLADYSGDVTFVVTDANANTYTKTISVSNRTFAAGTYNTTPYTISTADEKEVSVSWDLTKASYDSASTDLITWTSDNVTLTNAKGSSTTNANNYLGGTNAHTRVYKGHVMTITPKDGYEIVRAEFTSTTAGYASYLVDSEWNNASCTGTGLVATATPVDGTANMTVTIGEATRFTNITVYYKTAEAKTLESISIEGQTTEFVEGDEFAFGGTVTASYSNGATADVTAAATVTGYDMSTVGNQTVTVSFTYQEVTKEVSYDITVKAATLASIAVVGQTTAFTIGDTFEFDGTVTATYENGWSETIESGYTVNSDAVNMNTSGTYTVTVTYEGKTFEYTVTVSEAPAAGEEQTYTVSSFLTELGLSGTTTLVEGTKYSIGDDIIMTIAKGGSSNVPAVNQDGTLRLYYKAGADGGSMTLTSEKTITKVVFTFASGYEQISKASVGNYDTDTYTWTGSANSVTFTNGGGTKQARIKTMTITYLGVGGGEGGDTPVVETLATPTNVKATVDGKAVTLTWEAVANATSYYVTCGDQNTTVTATEAEFTMPNYGANYNITVVAKADGYNDSAAATTTVTTGADPNAGGGESGETTKYYVKVTEAPADWSGKYLIVWDTGAHATVSDSDLKKTADVTISNNQIASSATVDAAAVTVAATATNYYSVMLPNGKYLSLNANSNKVAEAASAFNIYFNYTTNGVQILGKDTASNERVVTKNASYYRAYKTSSSSTSGYTLPTLYKLAD